MRKELKRVVVLVIAFILVVWCPKGTYSAVAETNDQQTQGSDEICEHPHLDQSEEIQSDLIIDRKIVPIDSKYHKHVATEANLVHCPDCGEWVKVNPRPYEEGPEEHIFDSEYGECLVCEYKMNGWYQFDGAWYYYQTGTKVTGWQKVGGTWYYLESDGVMATGWQKIGSSWYYFKGGDSGAMVTGWQKIDGSWYYFKGGDNGSMVTGWQKLGGKWYYFKGGDNGAMVTGWQKIGSSWYYFKGGDNGTMVTGWQKIGGYWYYFKGGDNGAMVTGWQKIGGSWYYFKGGDNGAMVTGWQKISGKWYYFYSSGKMAANTRVDGYYINSSGVYVASSTSATSSVVYWVPNGSVYHKTRSCSALSRSHDIRSGSIAASGKSRACKVCY